MTESTDKREQSLIRKYGSPEALAAKRKEWQAKSRKNPNSRKGGFAYLKENDPAKLQAMSQKGVEARQNDVHTTMG